MAPARPILRTLLVGLAACAAIGLGGGPASAQTDDVSIVSAAAGFDGLCKANAWLPVSVTIKNTGPPVEAQLEVRQTDYSGGQNTIRRAVPLPSGAREAFTVPIFAAVDLARIVVRLRVEGTVRAEKDVSPSCLSANDRLYGVLAADPSSYNALAAIQPAGGLAGIAQLTPSQLPDEFQALEALDALVLAGVDTGALTDAQRRALHSWVITGGALMVVGGPDWQATTAGVADLLPLDPRGLQAVVDLNGLAVGTSDPEGLIGQALITTGGIRPGTRVLAEQNGVPLALERPLGAGRVIFLAADPSREPLRSWAGRDGLYRSLLGRSGWSPVWEDSTVDWSSAAQATLMIPGLGTLSVSTICGFLLLYVLIIGPLHIVALRKSRRREVAWITMPAVIILFSGLSVLVGARSRGSSVVLNRLAVMQVWPGTERALVHELVGIFSPYRARYDLEVPAPFLPHPFPQTGYSSAGNTDWTLEQTETGFRIADMRLEVGGTGALALEGDVPAPAIDADLTLGLDPNQARLRGEIVNRSELALTDSVLVTPMGPAPVGEIAPGETVRVDSSLASGGFRGYCGVADQLSANVNYDDPDDYRRLTLLNAMGSATAVFRDCQGGFYLAGWAATAPAAIDVLGQKPRVHDETLVLVILDPRLESGNGPLSVPPELFRSEVIEAPDYLTGIYGNTYSVSLFYGAYGLRFYPSPGLSFSRVEQLVFHFEGSGLSADGSPLLVSLWDRESGHWSSQAGFGRGDNFLAEPWRYVAPDGEILLRLENQLPSQGIEILEVGFTLVVDS